MQLRLSGNHIAMGVFLNSLIRVTFTAIIYTGW
jgi:hypothetical protein